MAAEPGGGRVNDNAEVVVSLTLVTKNQADIARAMETFGRAAAGLALEGISTSLSATRVEDDDDA